MGQLRGINANKNKRDLTQVSSPTQETEHQPRYPHVKCEQSNCSILLGATGSVLKDILNEQYGLNKSDDKVVVLPPVLFDGERSYADLEFLVYFNAYIAGNLFKGKPIQVVGAPDQCKAMEKFLASTISGPDWNDPTVYPFVKHEEREFFKNIAHHFAPKNDAGKVRPLSEYIQFIPFNRAGIATIDLQGDRSKIITIEKSGASATNPNVHPESFAIREYGRVNGKIRSVGPEMALPVSYDHPVGNDIPLAPDAAAQISEHKHGFAVTCLGNSTGFDAKGLVTSFIVWIGGTGVLVDPSEDALRKVDELGLSHHDLPLCLLTHCHQDHDGGLLKRMLQGQAINLMASRVVYEEFMSKADKLLEFQGKRGTVDPRLLVHWVEINPGDEISIETRSGKVAKFRNWWDIHPIPTNGFSVEFEGKSFGHSGDTQWSPTFIDGLVEKGVLTESQGTQQRELFFKDHRPRFDLLHMEAGGGQIHTKDLDIFEEVDPAYHHQISLYHVPDSAVHPSLGNLRKIGLGETQCIIEQTPINQFISQKGMIAEHPYFHGLSDHELQYFMSKLRTKIFQPGDEILTEGDPIKPGDCAFFIAEGKAALASYGVEVLAGGCVGDWGIITGLPRSTSVFAKGSEPLVTLMMEQEDLLYLLSRNGDFESIRNRLEFVTATNGDFAKFFTNFMGRVPPECMKAVFALVSPSAAIRNFDSDEPIFNIDENPDDGAFLVTDGFCNVLSRSGEVVGVVKAGSVVGEMAVLDNTTRAASVQAGLAGVTGITISKDAFNSLVHYYPALRNGLTLVAAERKEQLKLAA